MTDNFASQVQFASDLDGDLHLFPGNLEEPDYQNRWQIWVILIDGSREQALLNSPLMSVVDGNVMNPYSPSGIREVPGWFVDFLDSSAIEISIAEGPVVRFRHPRRSTDHQ